VKSNGYKIMEKKPQGKPPIGRPRHKWADNIKIDHRDMAV
jgi:hypothetical protein